MATMRTEWLVGCEEVDRVNVCVRKRETMSELVVLGDWTKVPTTVSATQGRVGREEMEEKDDLRATVLR